MKSENLCKILKASIVANSVLVIAICSLLVYHRNGYTDGHSGNSHQLCLEHFGGCGNETKTMDLSTAHVNLVNIILSEHEAKKDGYDNQRFSVMYFVNKPKNTGERLSLYTVKYQQNRQPDMKSITVPTSGVFVVFVSIELCFRSVNHDFKHVTAKILRHTGTETSVIYQKSIKAIKGVGSLAFVPIKGFFLIRLERNDTLTLEMQETGSMYDMKVGNVFGLQEVV